MTDETPGDADQTHEEPAAENTPPGGVEEEELTWEELAGWFEFGCWCVLVMSPFLYWVNGPAVSKDQFVVRCALVVIAVVGAAVSTVARIRRKRTSDA